MGDFGWFVTGVASTIIFEFVVLIAVAMKK